MEEKQRKWIQLDEVSNKEKLSARSCLVKFLCCGCRAPIKQAYFKLINEERRCVACINDPNQLIVNFMDERVPLWNLVVSLNIDIEANGRAELLRAGFTEAILEQNSSTGHYVIPWFLKLGIPGRQNIRISPWNGRKEYVFQTVELLILKSWDVWNGKEFVKQNYIGSSGVHGFALFLKQFLYYRFLEC
ncbi:MAG: hypothetical protein ACRCZO_03215 [Cetobacterium sp.]